jgi:hypothetical protein
MYNNIYNENGKIQAARQQFSVGGSISVTAQSCSLEGTLTSSRALHMIKCFGSAAQRGMLPAVVM